jgi:prolipoprotein diacylglyceryltransferase
MNLSSNRSILSILLFVKPLQLYHSILERAIMILEKAIMLLSNNRSIVSMLLFVKPLLLYHSILEKVIIKKAIMILCSNRTQATVISQYTGESHPVAP